MDDAPAPAAPGAHVADLVILRAMAHPARMALLGHLADSGPATATECADVVGLSPSAVSYHLRALARAGLVEAAPGRGDGRERLWRRSAEYSSIEVDAGPDIGIGHLKRCATLAAALFNLGCRIRFVCRDRFGPEVARLVTPRATYSSLPLI